MKHRPDKQKADIKKTAAHVLILIFLTLLLPGCVPSMTPTRHYEIMREKTKKHTGVDIDWEDIESGCRDVSYEIKKMLERGISRADAVNIALMNNHTLHADFESLGISRADLVQAGLYSNPSSDTIFLFPKNNCAIECDKDPVITFGITFSISDLWRVPLRKKVASDELEITTARILQTIIDTVALAKTAYDKHLYGQELYKTQKLIVENAKAMRDTIYEGKIYPNLNNADRNLSDVLLWNNQIELTSVDTIVQNAYIDLRNVLGIFPEAKPLKLTDSFILEHYALPEPEELNKIAFDNSPEIQMAKLKVQQATDSVAFERASFIQQFDGGFQYLSDSDGTKYIGPEIILDIPIFDNNGAQIAKAKAELKKARHEYIQTVNDVISNVQQAYQTASGYDEILALANKTVKASEQAILFTDQHFDIPELNIVNALQIRTLMYNELISLVKAHWDALTERNELERVIGKSFDLVPIKTPSQSKK